MAMGVGRQAASHFFPASAPTQQEKLGSPRAGQTESLCVGHPCTKHLFSLHPAPQCKRPCTLPSMAWKQPPRAIPVPTPLGRDRGWEEEEEDGGREERVHVGRKQGPGVG